MLEKKKGVRIGREEGARKKRNALELDVEERGGNGDVVRRE